VAAVAAVAAAQWQAGRQAGNCCVRSYFVLLSSPIILFPGNFFQVGAK